MLTCIVQGWSEGALVMSENYLQRHFKVGIPTWMRPTTWPQVNMQEPTFNDYEAAPQGIVIVPVIDANSTGVSPMNSTALNSTGSGMNSTATSG